MLPKVPRRASVALCSVLLFTFAGHATSEPSPQQGPFQKPSWATPEHLQRSLDAATPISVQVYLQMHNEAAALAELTDLSNPNSPRFRQFLTTEQFAAKYGPSQDDVTTVATYLQSFGLKISYTADNNAFVAADGTAAQIAKAFGTSLGEYQVGSALNYAPTAPVVVPDEVGTHIAAILGLATPTAMKAHSLRRDLGPLASSQATPTCSTFYGQYLDATDPVYTAGWPALTDAPCGYVPSQLRGSYGASSYITAGNTGAGQTIAIVDAFTPPTLVQDAQTYYANHDASHPFLASQITLLKAPGKATTVDTSWYDESTLDVEAVHAMAPGAHIVYMAAASANDSALIAAINAIVSGNLASIVSNSYGDLESQDSANFAAWQAVIVQAGLKGIGIYFSSGDSGDESTNNNGVATVDFPASLPYVTAVGGTSLAIAQNNSRTWERAWETGVSDLTEVCTGRRNSNCTKQWVPSAPGTYTFGSGGGTSKVFSQPTWQAGIVPAFLANAHGTASRVVPDVAMLGDPYTGFLIGQTQTSGRKSAYSEYAIGGTSLASPLFAATMALAQQQLGVTFGFANPLLYQASAKGAFLDIAPGAKEAVAIPGTAAATIDYHGAGNSNVSAVGYDATTGLGTVSSDSSFFAGLNAFLP